MPDSHNAGDFGSFLKGAPHAFGLTPEVLQAANEPSNPYFAG